MYTSIHTYCMCIKIIKLTKQTQKYLLIIQYTYNIIINKKNNNNNRKTATTNKMKIHIRNIKIHHKN